MVKKNRDTPIRYIFNQHLSVRSDSVSEDCRQGTLSIQSADWIEPTYVRQIQNKIKFDLPETSRWVRQSEELLPAFPKKKHHVDQNTALYIF